MATTEKTYKRLPGKGYRRVGMFSSFIRSQLWMGDDHLLSLDTCFCTEDYKRFYYREIQALVVRKTAGQIVSGIALGLIAAVLFLFYLTVPTVWLMIPLLLFAALFVVEIARGTTCECFVRTAVQTEKLPSINRVRVAKRVLAMIVPKILEAQGIAPGSRFVPPAAAPLDASAEAASGAQAAFEPAAQSGERGEAQSGEQAAAQSGAQAAAE